MIIRFTPLSLEHVKQTRLGGRDYLQTAVADPLVALEGGAAGEVARPEVVSVVRVREEVVRLHRPGGGAGGGERCAYC